jgi:hypothetical protein
VKEAFHKWFSWEHSYSNLYKIYEFLEENANKRQLEEWVTKNKITNFKRTANSKAAIGDKSRHEKEKGEPPKNPMCLSEADALITTIFKNWLNWKCQRS